MAKSGSRAKKNWRNRFRVFKRKRLVPIWRDLKWPLVWITWLLALAMGYRGFFNHAVATGTESYGFDYLYRALQLIVLQSGDVPSPVPWQLELARFLLPALAAYTAIQALMVIFRDQWQLLRVRFLKNHIILCGLGERGLRIAEEFLAHGYQVVVIEEDEENPLTDQLRKEGAVVMIGDATEPGLLARAGVQKARYLVAVCADDGTNAEIALLARELARLRKDRPLTAYVHIIDLDLCKLLGGWSLASTDSDYFRLEFFNVLERGARLMLKEHPPFDEASIMGKKQPHIVVVGSGKMIGSLIVEAARKWWLKTSSKDRALRISVVDRLAQTVIQELRMHCPRLEKACSIDIHPVGKDDPGFAKGDFLFDDNGQIDVNAIYVCFDDDAQGLVNALILDRKTRTRGVPVIVRMNRESGLSTLIRAEDYMLELGHIHIFSLLDKTCSLEAVLGGVNEVLARATHENYIEHQRRDGFVPEVNPSMVSWDELPEDLKDSNRDQAAHYEIKLKAIGCGIQPLTDWEGANFYFTEQEIETLAEMEHERWCDERHRRGWTYSPEPKSLKKKTSPYLVPWDELSGEVREYDRNTVRGLPSFLARAGFQIYRMESSN